MRTMGATQIRVYRPTKISSSNRICAFVPIKHEGLIETS